MNWIMGIVIIAATLAALLPAPNWLRVLSIGVAGATILTSLLSDMNKNKRLQFWARKHRVWLFLLPTLIIFNFTSRIFETVWDFSYGKIYALRNESVEWISKIKEPISILIFLKNNDKSNDYVSWLKESATKLGNHLTIETHNINRDVALAKRYDIKATGETVLVAGERWVTIPNFKESTVVAGLARLLTREGKSICFITGHGEREILSKSENGLSLMAETLSSIGYGVDTVSLISTSAEILTQKCALLAVIGTQTELFPTEIKTLQSLSGKIPMLFALGTDAPQSMANFLNDLGISLGRSNLLNPGNVERMIPVTDIVIEVQTIHPITNGLQGFIFLPQVQALLPNDSSTPPWSTVLGIPASDSIQNSETPAEHGPFIVAGSRSIDPSAPIVVIGSSNVFSNSSWKFGKNASFAIQTMRWILNEESLNIPSAAMIDEPLMDLSERDVNWITNGVFYIFPGTVLLLCFLVWWRHRWL